MAINQSNLPTKSSFRIEDFPGADEWFAQFLSTLNLFTEQMYFIVNGNVGYQNIVAPRFYTKVITTPTAGVVTFNFSNPLRIQPTSVVVGNIYQENNPSLHPTNATIAYWHISQNVIYIDDLPNLTPATQYTVTLQVS